MNNLIWSVIGLLVLAHGYFFVRYQTYDPCGAAVARTVQEGRILWSASPDRGAKDLMTCYYVALTGEVPQELAQTSKK
jgi:hypothetical protein